MQKADLIKSARKHIAEALELIDIADTMEPKRGKWIEMKFSRFTYYKCSVCNANYGCENAEFDLNYCPNCGAQMERIDND